MTYLIFTVTCQRLLNVIAHSWCLVADNGASPRTSPTGSVNGTKRGVVSKKSPTNQRQPLDGGLNELQAARVVTRTTTRPTTVTSRQGTYNRWIAA